MARDARHELAKGIGLRETGEEAGQNRGDTLVALCNAVAEMLMTPCINKATHAPNEELAKNKVKARYMKPNRGTHLGVLVNQDNRRILRKLVACEDRDQMVLANLMTKIARKRKRSAVLDDKRIDFDNVQHDCY